MASGSGERTGTRLRDRPEYKDKQKPPTRPPDATVAEAESAMTDKNYGCVIVTDDVDKVIGVVTERDIMNKLVGRGMDAKTTPLSEIMTENPRVAREDDDMLDWLRMMSNERFRRLPVVDGEGRIKAVFTQGDFVSYTWPDLIGQMRSIVRAQVGSNFHYVLIGGAIIVYILAMVVVLAVV